MESSITSSFLSQIQISDIPIGTPSTLATNLIEQLERWSFSNEILLDYVLHFHSALSGS